MHPPDLLSWSPSLDTYLLNHPFRSFSPTSTASPSSSLPLLYKLATSSATSQLFFILLDPSTCTVFCEGLSQRTLSRRVQLQHPSVDTQTQSEHDVDRVAEAVHDALLDASPSRKRRRTIGLEATRFSASLFIDARDQDDNGPRFKVTFDLDPLDAAASKSFLEGHFIGPLLSVAARAAGSSKGSADGGEETTPLQQQTLDCLARYALKRRGLPCDRLTSPKRVRGIGSDTARDGIEAAQVLPSPPLPLDSDGDTDESDLVFFGPPPTNWRRPSTSKEAGAETSHRARAAASSSPPLFSQTQAQTQAQEKPKANGSQGEHIAAWRVPPSPTAQEPRATEASTSAAVEVKDGHSAKRSSARFSISPESSSSSEEEESLLPVRTTKIKPAPQRRIEERLPSQPTSARASPPASSSVATASSASSRTVKDEPSADSLAPTPTPIQTQTRSAEQRAREMEKRREIERIKEARGAASARGARRGPGRTRF